MTLFCLSQLNFTSTEKQQSTSIYQHHDPSNSVCFLAAPLPKSSHAQLQIIKLFIFGLDTRRRHSYFKLFATEFILPPCWTEQTGNIFDLDTHPSLQQLLPIPRSSNGSALRSSCYHFLKAPSPNSRHTSQLLIPEFTISEQTSQSVNLFSLTMSSLHRSPADSALEDIFRWPMEGWTNEKIGYILFAHRIRHRAHSTKEVLLTKLMEWALDRRPSTPAVDRVKSKVRRAYREMITAGFRPLSMRAFSRRYVKEEMEVSCEYFWASRTQCDEYSW
ncbi:hypothetical protein BKA65DRAFT_481655 [Rhexocercosporidium sp. MPI-PUGE-AT-0058]|nr:hypothetical protein BKA65DRAFT_481655 [Rhexocercosporidium sp. MPI-PUGE-AT-0058]